MILSGATQTQYNERQGLLDLLATDLLPERKVVIDGGAHVGTWTEIFSSEFDRVHAFESGPAWDYLEKNCGALENVTLHHAALTDQNERLSAFHRKRRGKMTSFRVRPDPAGKVEGVTIDSLQLDECSMIKLDIEGYEYKALMGARKTIKAHRPFLLVEFAGHGKHAGANDGQVRQLIENRLGYRQVWNWGVDFGFVSE